MAQREISIPRATDAAVVAFFQKLHAQFGFQPGQTHVVGMDATIPVPSPQADTLRDRGQFSIVSVHGAKNPAHIAFIRNSDASRFGAPDKLTINNPGTTLSFDEMLSINELINDTFTRNANAIAPALAEQGPFAEILASHLTIANSLEQSLTKIGEQFAAERLKLEKEQLRFVQEKQAEYANLEQKLREELAVKETALSDRQKELDDRDNMHARRGLRSDLKRRLQEHATRFQLTGETRRLRLPVHAAVLLALLLFVIAIGYSWALLAKTPGDIGLMVKSGVLTVAALGVLAWYLRWMNRWFEQHADAEFNLKQFELDIDRASWVVETAMEWRASQHGVIPTSLLESISRNLFFRQDRIRDEEMHPADYLASALLGNASKARIKLGDAELDYNRGALKKAASTVEKP